MSSWYDMMVAEEQHQTMRIVRMTPTEWKAEIQHLLRTAHGKTHRVLNYIRAMEVERMASAVAATPAPVALPESNPDMRMWRDMVEEPEKYGDDIGEWLELDAKLRAAPGRWRIDAYWLEKEMEMEQAEMEAQAPWRDIYSVAARQAAAAGMNAWVARDIKRHVARFKKAILSIQAAVRGHQVRTKLNFLDCCMCLSHRICPLETDVGMMCRDCAEQGPHEDITGPVADPWNWFRADYVDQTLPMFDEPRPATGMGGCLFCRKSGYKGHNTENDPFFCGEKCRTKYDRWVDSQYNPRVPQYPFCPLRQQEEQDDDVETCRACRTTFGNGLGPGFGFCSRDCMRDC
jgi:hypothetical protein